MYFIFCKLKSKYISGDPETYKFTNHENATPILIAAVKKLKTALHILRVNNFSGDISYLENNNFVKVENSYSYNMFIIRRNDGDYSNAMESIKKNIVINNLIPSWKLS